MSVVETMRARVVVDGKGFRTGAVKFLVKGLAYGPFPPGDDGTLFPDPASAARDLDLIGQLGANVLRVYAVPPTWFLDLAAATGLRLLVDVPWENRQCFLDSAAARETIRAAVRAAAGQCARHPAVFAISVGNEIPPDVVRWSGAAAVADFLDRLVLEVKSVDPDRLCTYGNFPPTEYLHPREVDFYCFNVYLHERRALRNYLARLQMLADTKPLVLGECGMDAQGEGEAAQADLLGWSLETAFRAGAAGAVVFAFTDEWFKDGQVVTGWQFGLTTAQRRPRPAWSAVRRAFGTAPTAPRGRQPPVSVVVAAYNAGRTIETCLESLGRLNYPDYEVILVDDGSTDVTPQIAASFERVRVVRHAANLGLSVARNTGIGAARGAIIAFTDADCRADEDWLRHAVRELVEGDYAGVGGHNLLPPEDSRVAAAVMASPGGPAHVMLTDRVAEHIPGCNMVFWKWALEAVGGFDPVFRLAGDDVDLCWRLQRRGHSLGFSPAGFVWHYRRSTVREYLRQQRGYGAAEAMLERKHPENFNRLGGGIWRGNIYAQSGPGLRLSRPIVYHGPFGGGLFQSVYAATSALPLVLLTSIEYYAVVVVPVAVLATMAPAFRLLASVALAAPFVVCGLAAGQVSIPRRQERWWSRPLVALLFLLQPLARGWARYQGRLMRRERPLDAFESLDSLSRKPGPRSEVQAYWAPNGIDRVAYLRGLLSRLGQRGWQHRADSGWSGFDLEVYGSRWCKLRLTTVTERSPLGGQTLRGRLRPAWTLPTRIAVWGLLGAAFAIIGLFPSWRPWVWLLLLSVPLAMLLVRQRQRDLRRVFGTFLDHIAESDGLIRLNDAGQPLNPSQPPSPPAASPPAESPSRPATAP